MYDYSTFNHKLTVHVITDLEACYNRQQSNIYRIVEESLGVLREGIKLIAKVIPVMKYYLYTGFRISTILYGRPTEEIVGTRQENRFSGDGSRDTSFYIIREIEKQKLGVAIRSPIVNKLIQRAVITFVDDTNFYTNGKN